MLGFVREISMGKQAKSTYIKVTVETFRIRPLPVTNGVITPLNGLTNG